MDTPLLNGIDVSQYQGIIDWEQVAKSNLDFVFIRLGYAGYDGSITLDTLFHRNMEEALKYNLPVGVYVYSYFRTKESAKTAAVKTIEFITPYRLQYPIVLAFEDSLYQRYDAFANSLFAITYLNALEKANYAPMLYTYAQFATLHFNLDMLQKYPLWIADYHEPIRFDRDYGIWQYSNQGNIPGITVPVNLNYAYQDYAELIQTEKRNPYALPQKEWAVHIFSFENQQTALALKNALALLQIESTIKRMDDDIYRITVSHIPSFQRACEIQDGIKLLKNYYSEIEAE